MNSAKEKDLMSLINFENLTNDGGVMKKIITRGFSKFSPVNGDEVKVHFNSYLEDGRSVENTKITKDPQNLLIGGNSVTPGLEIGMKSMKMGEHAKIIIKPEYSFLALNNAYKSEIQSKTQDEISKMEIKEAKLYSTIIYEIELIKYDIPRKNKVSLQPEERIQEASSLKNEGNELFKSTRYMEAILKYNDAWDYLTQLPNEFLSEKIFELRLQLKLNITNCHLALHEYNYALKKLEEIFPMKNPPVIKFYYYRAIAQMNLGEFENCEEDINSLEKVLQNDPLVTKLKGDLILLKEKTLKTKKDLIKKGFFNNNLYEEKLTQNINIGNNNLITLALPRYNPNNLSFYIDLIVNNDMKSPQKLKFEIFDRSAENSDELKKIVSMIKNEIKTKIFKSCETIGLKKINLSHTNDMNNLIEEHLIIPIRKYSTSEDLELLEKFFKNISENKIRNLYPPNEELILFFYLDDQEDKFSLNITLRKLSDVIVPNIFVIGRVFYKTGSLLKFMMNPSSESLDIQITDCDFSHFI